MGDVMTVALNMLNMWCYEGETKSVMSLSMMTNEWYCKVYRTDITKQGCV